MNVKRIRKESRSFKLATCQKKNENKNCRGQCADCSLAITNAKYFRRKLVWELDSCVPRCAPAINIFTITLDDASGCTTRGPGRLTKGSSVLRTVNSQRQYSGYLSVPPISILMFTPIESSSCKTLSLAIWVYRL